MMELFKGKISTGFNLLFVSLILINFSLFGQDLDVNETIAYLNRKFQESPYIFSRKTSIYHIEISPKGELIIIDNETEEPEYSFDKTRFSKTIRKIDISKINIDKSFKPFTISGTNGISITPVYKGYIYEEYIGYDGKTFLKRTVINDGGIIENANITIWFNDISQGDNYCNALKHLCNLVLSQPSKYRLNTQNSDPFSSPIQISKSDIDNDATSNVIKLSKNAGGVYEVPIVINDVLKINFIFDSGASEVSISPEVALTLIKTGTISDSDWLPSKVFQFADGSTAKSSRFLIHKLKIGNLILTDIETSISQSVDAPMLIGQNVMKQLGNYLIDNENQILIINLK
jgi:predicted aspartyl protease